MGRVSAWTFAAVSASLVLAARAAVAEEGEPTEVVVRGSGRPSAGGFEGRASEADAAREPTDIAGIVEALPGVHVRRLGPSDTFSTVSIRGSTSSEVSVLLAGVPLTGGADPSLDLASLPLWPGARVRVFRSFAPAALGSGSLGGTLVLEPPRTTDADGTSAWLGVGSFGEARLRLADVHGLLDGRARVVTALSASRATDDFTYYDAVHSTATTPAFRTRENAEHASVQALASLALPVAAGDRPGDLTITAVAQDRAQHLPGAATTPTSYAELWTNREVLSFAFTRSTGAASAIRLLAWTRRDEVTSHDTRSALHPYDVALATDDVTLGAGGAAVWNASVGSRLTVDARVDGSFERFAPGSDRSDLGPVPGATRSSVGGGLDLAWRPVARWTLSGSARLDASVDAAESLASSSAVGVPVTGIDSRPTGHVGTELALGPLTLAAHAGGLARAPSFAERYGGAGILRNPAVRGEAALTVDTGARVATRIGQLKVELEADGFATHASELITLVPEGALGLLKATNVSAARIFGVESGVAIKGFGVDVRLAYTGLLTFNDDATNCPACSASPPLVGRPAHDFVGDVAYAYGPVRIRYGLDAVAQLHADARGQTQVPARVLQSVGARFVPPWYRAVRVAVDVSNLLDVRTGLTTGFMGLAVREPIGDQFAYPLPGRAFLISARWTVGKAAD